MRSLTQSLPPAQTLLVALSVDAGTESCLGSSGISFFSLTLPGADLVLLEFLLQLCFLADIKPTWATKPPSTLLTSGEGKSQESTKFQRNGCLQLGLICNICSNSTFSRLWFSSPAPLLLLQDLHPLPSPRPSPLVHTKSCPGWTHDPR